MSRADWEMSPPGLATWCENKAKGHEAWAKRTDKPYHAVNEDYLRSTREKATRTAARYRAIAAFLRGIEVDP